MNTHALFLSLLFTSYAVGWILNGLLARSRGTLDLCQFVQSFILSPLVLFIIICISFLSEQFIIKVFIPHWKEMLILFISAVGVGTIIFLTARYAVVPAVKKTYGIAKPFSEKICIILYKKA